MAEHEGNSEGQKSEAQAFAENFTIAPDSDNCRPRVQLCESRVFDGSASSRAIRRKSVLTQSPDGKWKTRILDTSVSPPGVIIMPGSPDITRESELGTAVPPRLSGFFMACEKLWLWQRPYRPRQLVAALLAFGWGESQGSLIVL